MCARSLRALRIVALCAVHPNIFLVFYVIIFSVIIPSSWNGMVATTLIKLHHLSLHSFCVLLSSSSAHEAHGVFPPPLLQGGAC